MNAKYTPEQAAQLVASDEPTFILRAKDSLAVGILREYIVRYGYYKQGTPEGKQALEEMLKAFHDWEHTHYDQMQFPTI